MRTITTGIALSLVACVSPVDVSGVEQGIVGGQVTDIANFKSVVALENSPGNWFCTGTLVDKDWVLTAAHCVVGETNISVRFDDNNVNDTSGGKVVKVAEIHGNPGYNDNAWDNDVALLKLSTSVTDREPTPIVRTAPSFGTMFTQVGYGDADNNGGGAGILRKLDTPNIDCATAGDPTLSNANVLCFNAADGNASCYGDSGGPAFITVNGKLGVAGITSGGTTDSCTQGTDVYTSVPGELAFVDMFVPHGTDPTDPTDPGNPGNPDPTNPQPDPHGNDGADDGGCSAGGSAGLLVGLGALIAMRRRRR